MVFILLIFLRFFNHIYKMGDKDEESAETEDEKKVQVQLTIDIDALIIKYIL